jgi:AraC-like DNA-binding protein
MPRPDRHNEIEINFLNSGSLTYLMGGQRVTVQPRCVVAFWAAVPHQIVSFDKLSFYYVVTVPVGWVLQWGLPQQLVAALTHGRVVGETDSQRAALDRQLFEQWHVDVEGPDKTARDIMNLEVRARLMRLADSLKHQENSSTGLADAARSCQLTHLAKAETMACFVARNYTSRIQVRDIAACVGLHPDYAATLFRRTFKTTMNVLITRHRIAHAQRQLIMTSDRVFNIARDSGFDSLSRFNRAFKQIAGINPRQYRKTLGLGVASAAAQSGSTTVCAGLPNLTTVSLVGESHRIA